MITLVPATPDHLAYFKPIDDAAWTHDTNTLMKAVPRGANWLSDDDAERLKDLLAHPRVQIVVAVDDAAGGTPAPVGWLSWGFRGFSPEELADLKTFTAEDRSVSLSSPTKEMIEKADSRPPPEVPPTPEMSDEERKAGAARIDAMEKVTSAHMDEFMERVMPEGVKCLYVYGLCVSPTTQGTGVGSELLKWGMRRCDKVGTFAWQHASESARFVLEKVKWEIVDTLEMDLDEWDPRPEGKREGSWGKYTFRYFRYPTVEERKEKERVKADKTG